MSQTLRSRTNGTTYQVFGEVSYDLVKSEQTRVEPFARIHYAKVDSGVLSETGGSAALVAGKQSVDLTQMAFGLRGTYVIGRTALLGSAGWLRSTGDRAAATTMGIAGVGTTSSIQAVALDKDALALEAQARIALTDMITLGVGYSGIMGSNNNDHGARATLSIGF